MLNRLRSVVITLIVLGAVVGVAHTVVVIAESIREPRPWAGEARAQRREVRFFTTNNEKINTVMRIQFVKQPPTLEAFREHATDGSRRG